MGQHTQNGNHWLGMCQHSQGRKHINLLASPKLNSHLVHLRRTGLLINELHQPLATDFAPIASELGSSVKKTNKKIYHAS
jgi:hypothetical protein